MRSSSSLLLLYKPSGVTSFASLKPVKRTISKKVGHAGTLDKFAEGLMIVLTGTFTKLNPLFSNLDKRYIATILFGKETSTLDPEGEVVATAEVPSIDEISAVLESQFLGTIDQAPPQYSAVHIDGKRAYKMARAGEEVEMPTRKVTIHALKIISWSAPVLQLEVHCSKGTYIRSLARDIAIACGSRGHLTALERTAIGPYFVKEAIDPDDSETLQLHGQESAARISRLPHMGSVVVDTKSAHRLTYGNLPTKNGILRSDLHKDDEYAMIIDEEGILLAITGIDNQGIPNKVYALPCMEKGIV
jgi:tRNA pseudouridine55 synthase